ncbi:TRAP transporter small permease [Pseudogemmobacter sonorensis]|uniref:TRAP transporter small permease n=1 Tax=Pseudogemmobacter sonorensis TaxID=2989681 RepID=UPI00367CD16E
MTLLARTSRWILRGESALGAAIVAVIALAVLAGSVARGLGLPLIWTDELATHLMVWLAFLGASTGVALRNHMVMGLLPEHLSARGRRILARLVGLLVLAFWLAMLAVCWRWLDPPGLIRAGGGRALARETFNFVWTDPTVTLGVRKIWFWLIVPLTSVTGLIHALAALAADWHSAREGAQA